MHSSIVILPMILALNLFFLVSSAQAGVIEEFQKEYCLYGGGTGSTTPAWEVQLGAPSGAFVSCSGTITVTPGLTSLEIVNLLRDAFLNDCPLGVTGQLGVTTACQTTSPPSVGFTLKTLMSPADLALEPVGGGTPVVVTPGNPVPFNPVVYVPEPSIGALVATGGSALIVLARRRRPANAA